MGQENESKIQVSSGDSEESLSSSNRQLNISDIKDTLDKLEQTKSEINSLKKDFLVILGIFVSFTTFISVEIQIFKVIESFWLLFGLSSFILGAVLVFAITLINIIHKKDTWIKAFSPSYVLVYILLAITIFAFSVYFKTEQICRSRDLDPGPSITDTRN